MANKPLPSQEVLRQLLRYEPETGKLFWRERDISLFEDGKWNSAFRKAAIWNGKNAGKQALSNPRRNGYLAGAIFGQLYVTHRIIWKLVHGEEPDFIDHINGDPTDNRIENLRSVSKRENSMNRKRSGQGMSGVLGVNWHKRIGKWQVKIGVHGRTLHIGYFDHIAEAEAARREASRRFGFHQNHGR